MDRAAPIRSARHLTSRDNLTAIQSHVLAEEAKHAPQAGSLSWVLSALSLRPR